MKGPTSTHRFRDPLPYERVPSSGIMVGGKPVLALPRGTKVEGMKDFVDQRIEISLGVRDLVEGCFGPRGMYKLIFSDNGGIFLTNDSTTILSRVKLDHPMAQVLAGAGVDAGKASGGGSTTTILLATSMMSALLSLIKAGYRPSVVLKGCSQAYAQARKTAKSLASVAENPQSHIVDVARSSLGCTVLSAHKDIFAGLVADAVTAGKDSRGLDDIYVRAQAGGCPRESRLVRGVALMREPIHSSMKKSFRNAKLLVVKGEFQIEKQGRTNYYDHNFRVETPEEYRKLLGSKRDILVRGLGKISECRADIILVEKGVDEALVDYFVKRGMAVIRRFPPPEFDHVVEATGAMPVSDFHDISESDLVEVERAEYTKIGDTWWWLLEGFKNPRTCELLVRGTDQMLFDEIQRVLKACFKEVKLYLENPTLTYGGGWFEMMIARDLRRYAFTLPGREQNVVEKVAEAFESIPSSLAESSGMDKLDAMIELRSRLSKNGGFYGIDCGAGKISDVKDLGLVEPSHVKVQALQSAFEAAFTLLRVDQVVRARELSKEEAYYVERQEKTSVEALNKHQRDYGL